MQLNTTSRSCAEMIGAGVHRRTRSGGVSLTHVCIGLLLCVLTAVLYAVLLLYNELPRADVGNTSAVDSAELQRWQTYKDSLSEWEAMLKSKQDAFDRREARVGASSSHFKFLSVCCSVLMRTQRVIWLQDMRKLNNCKLQLPMRKLSSLNGCA